VKLDRFARHMLTFGATPIEPLRRLSAHLGGKVEIWAKREDCNSGLAFGGNKLRKLEYLVPDALAKGCDTLVSIGGVQSNHTRLVAAVAAKIGMKCRLVQGSWVDWPDAAYDRVGNIQLSRILGAKLEFSTEDFNIALRDSWQRAVEAVEREGGKPYGIPAGASDHRLGGLGYAGFAEEVRAQERDLGIRFDHILTASGSGSTQAGMVAGFKEDGRAASVIGIDITAKPAATRAVVKRIAGATAELLEVAGAISDADITLNEAYAYPAYGVPSQETLDAIRLCARLEGMITDPVYEGKSMQALIDLVRKDAFPAGSKVLYVHLGGAPALSAYGYPFRDG
jgi:1-aminocyclopropane-1-carboxylate deaminase